MLVCEKLSHSYSNWMPLCIWMQFCRQKWHKEMEMIRFDLHVNCFSLSLILCWMLKPFLDLSTTYVCFDEMELFLFKVGILLQLIASASVPFVFVCGWDNWFNHNHIGRACFTLTQMICTSLFIYMCVCVFSVFLAIECKTVICLCWSYTIQTHAINYEYEQPSPTCQWGLLLLLGMGHSGHEGQSNHGSPAGFGSSAPLIDPRPAEQTADLDVTLVLWLLQGPRQILWWVIKPNCLYGWLAPRS